MPFCCFTSVLMDCLASIIRYLVAANDHYRDACFGSMFRCLLFLWSYMPHGFFLQTPSSFSFGMMSHRICLLSGSQKYSREGVIGGKIKQYVKEKLDTGKDAYG